MNSVSVRIPSLICSAKTNSLDSQESPFRTGKIDLASKDNLVIFGQYLGIIVMAGSYVSLGVFFSSLTNNQIISFILSIVVSFVFTISGFPLMINFISQVFPVELVELISSFSFLTHFSSIQTGFFSLKGLMFFISFMALWNYLTLIKFANRE